MKYSPQNNYGNSLKMSLAKDGTNGNFEASKTKKCVFEKRHPSGPQKVEG